MRFGFVATVALALATGCATGPGTAGGDPLEAYVEARVAERPGPERTPQLEELARCIAAADRVELVFICTHNSRRSHLAQVWAQTAARRFGLDGVTTYSGGTEATAFNPRAVAALERAGFDVAREGDDDNPDYLVRDGHGPAMRCFSKAFDDPTNPRSGFVAVMTCSDADRACPAVPGAARRFAIPYVDPKVADGTPREVETYDERCAQIAREMLWLMRRAATLAAATRAD